MVLIRTCLIEGENPLSENPLSEKRPLIGRCDTTPSKKSPQSAQKSPLERGFQEVKKHFLKSPVEEGMPQHFEGQHMCPVDRGACKGLPHNPLQSEPNLRNFVAPHTKNTDPVP